MKPLFCTFLVALLATLVPGRVGAQRPVDDIKFLKMSVPGKIERVSWSVLRDQCSIQIWGPSFPIAVGDPTNEIQAHEALFPRTQVWLLKSDGTAIRQTRKPERGGVGDNGSARRVVAAYFPASACKEAISVVVKVDEQFLVEPLPLIK